MRLTQRNTLAISELARAATSELRASHHQRKQRIWRFLSNDNFAPISAQCALIPAICQLAGIKGFTLIMIGWSDLGRKRNGLFAAACFRRRGLPLLSWATTPEELNPSPSLLAEMFIRRLLEHLSDRVCPLLLAGLRVLWLFRRRVCLWGRLGLLRLGVEYYLAGHTGTAARMAGLARPRKWVRVGVWRALKSLLWVRDGVKRKRRPFSRTSTGVGPTGFG